MFFEFSTFLRYVLPQKKKRSRSILSLIAILVIASIVWLVTVFLSVTSGIENKWLGKITALHAPLAVYPNEHYYNSYYYRIDSLAADSNYHTKTLGEKLAAPHADPYRVGFDVTPPQKWPKVTDPEGALLDIAKTAQSIFASHSQEVEGLTFDDFTSSGAQFFLDKPQRLSFHQGSLIPSKTLRGMALIQSFSHANKKLKETLMPLTAHDFEHLYRTTLQQEEGGLSAKLTAIFTHAKPLAAQVNYLSPALLSELVITQPINCYLSTQGAFLLIPDSSHTYQSDHMLQGKLSLCKGSLVFTSENNKIHPIAPTTPCYSDAPLSLNIEKVNLPTHPYEELSYQGLAQFKGHSYPVTLPAIECQVTEVAVSYEFDTMPQIAPPWPFFVAGMPHYPPSNGHIAPMIAPKQWQAKGYVVGDKGHLSYYAATTSSAQEQTLPFYIAGFYDAGISAVAAKSLMLPKAIVTAISETVDDTFYSSFSSNGFNLFFEDNGLTQSVTHDLKQAFEKAGIASYFTFVPYYEYEFAKDLLQQFKSDRYLFSVVSLIILLVATTNIVSMLVVMVNDRKKEIAILLSLGASKKSLASIFMAVGAFIGLISAALGLTLAYLTLGNLDSIIGWLSYFQGHDVFSEVFYGKSLATTLSPGALKLILIATPLLSLIAGAIPAWVACKVTPSPLLKAEAA